MAPVDRSRDVWKMIISTPLPEFPSRLSSYTAWREWPADERDSVCRKYFAETPPPRNNLSPEAEEKEGALGLETLIRDHEEINNREHCKPYEAYVVAETSSWVQRMYALIAHLDAMPQSALLHYTTGCHKLETVIPPLQRLIIGDPQVWYPLAAEILVNHLLLHGSIARNKEFRRGQRWESARGVEMIRTTLLELGSAWAALEDKYARVLDRKIKSFAQAPQQEQLRESLELLLGCAAGFGSLKAPVMDSLIEGMLLARKHQLDRERDASVEVQERQLFALRRTAAVEAHVISWVVTGKKVASRWCNPEALGHEEFTEQLVVSVAEKLAVEPELWQLAKRAFLCIPELASAFWDLLPAHPSSYTHAKADRHGWAPRRRVKAAPEHADPFELMRLKTGRNVPETSSCQGEGAPFGLAVAKSAEQGVEINGRENAESKSASDWGPTDDEDEEEEEEYVSKRDVGKWLVEGSLDASWDVESDDVMESEQGNGAGLGGEPLSEDAEAFLGGLHEGHRALNGLLRGERSGPGVQFSWGVGRSGAVASAGLGASGVVTGKQGAQGDCGAGPSVRIAPSAREVGVGGRNGPFTGFPVADPSKNGKLETVINMWPNGQLRVVQARPESERGEVPLRGNSDPQDESVCSGGLFEGPVWSEHFPQVGYDGDGISGFRHQFLQEGGGEVGDGLRGEGEWPSDWDSEGEQSFGWEIDDVRPKPPSLVKTAIPETGRELYSLKFNDTEDVFFGEGEYESGGETDEEPSLNWRLGGLSGGEEDSEQRPDWLAEDWGSEDSQSEDVSGSWSGGAGAEQDVDFGGGGAETEVDSGGVQEEELGDLQEVAVGKKRKTRSDAGKKKETKDEKRRRLIDELEGFDDSDLDSAEIEGLKAAFVDAALAAKAAPKKGGRKAGKAAPRKKKTGAKTPKKPSEAIAKRSDKRKGAEIVPGWGGLPSDLLIEILRRSNPDTTTVASAVCKSWRPVALSDEVWSQHYATEFGELPRAKPLNKGGRSSQLWCQAFWLRSRASCKQFICPECGRPCAKNADLKRHLRLAHTGGLQCELCSETTRYRSEKGLAWHMQEKHREEGEFLGVQELNCALCHARCKTQQTMDEHVKTMHTERDQLEYACSSPQCSFATRTLRLLKRHCKDLQHPLPRPHLACPRLGCAYHGYTRLEVRQHAYSHASQCAECGFQYPAGYNRWGPHPEMPEVGICDCCRAKVYRSKLPEKFRMRVAPPDE